VTHLRKMMLEELQRRTYSEITTRKYLQYVTAFARHFGKSLLHEQHRQIRVRSQRSKT
jgi:hypothetical protein